MPRLVEIKALDQYRIWLRYDDGTQGEVDLSDLAGRGVFEVWSDPAVFRAVRLGSHGSIQWSDDLELCQDAMYLRLTGKTVEDVLGTTAATSADA